MANTRSIGLVLSVWVLYVAAAQAKGDPCPYEYGPTRELRSAVAAVLGSQVRSRPDADGKQSVTEIKIQRIIKHHAALDGLETITVSLSGTPKEVLQDRYVLFGKLQEGRLTWTLGSICATAEIAAALTDYLGAGTRLEKAEPAERLSFFVRHLDHGVKSIADDSFQVLLDASHAELKRAGKSLDAKKLAAMLQSNGTRVERLGRYGLLLGHAGDPAYAPLLRQTIESAPRQTNQDYVGLLIGYLLLDRMAAERYVLGLLEQKDFQSRASALGAMRFMLDELPREKQGDLLKRLYPTLSQRDFCDLTIEELRRRKDWGAVEKVLALYPEDQNSRTRLDPIVRRAIIRYALRCPEPKAKAFVTKLRHADPAYLADLEEQLRFEDEVAK